MRIPLSTHPLDREAQSVLPVRFAGCVVPDTFRDVPGLDVEVTVEGELCDTCHTFDASMLIAKCHSKWSSDWLAYRVPPCAPDRD